MKQTTACHRLVLLQLCLENCVNSCRLTSIVLKLDLWDHQLLTQTHRSLRSGTVAALGSDTERGNVWPILECNKKGGAQNRLRPQASRGRLDHVTYVTMTTDQLCDGWQHAGRECDQEHHSWDLPGVRFSGTECLRDTGCVHGEHLECRQFVWHATRLASQPDLHWTHCKEQMLWCGSLEPVVTFVTCVEAVDHRSWIDC